MLDFDGFNLGSTCHPECRCKGDVAENMVFGLFPMVHCGCGVCVRFNSAAWDVECFECMLRWLASTGSARAAVNSLKVSAGYRQPQMCSQEQVA